MESATSCCRPKMRPSLRSIFLSVTGLWVEIWHRNKTACSESNPVQSSRSKSTTWTRKGRLLRFDLNSPATSHGGAQNLGNNVRRDSESIGTTIATKVCSQIGRKWNVMFEGHVVTSVDRTSFDFRFEDFLSSLPLQTIIYCVTDQPSITRSRRYVLNLKLSVLTCSRSINCSMSIEHNCAKWRYFNSNLCRMQ